MSDSDKVFLKNITAKGIIGLCAKERQKPQEIRADICVRCDLWKAGVSDQIQDSIDYSSIANLVKIIISNSKFYLLEALAEKLSAEILREYNAAEIEITLSKSRVLPFVQEAGVTIVRQNKTPRLR